MTAYEPNPEPINKVWSSISFEWCSIGQGACILKSSLAIHDLIENPTKRFYISMIWTQTIVYVMYGDSHKQPAIIQ